ncbi:MAG TPA: hypothetical protein VFH88_02440 [Candidatus Krumholzibacteria bacterium]|nr:hypothetical protein [Candidatus Krumholzibacteria bacterium]
MRSLRFGLWLVFLLAASIILIRTLGHAPRHETPHERLARLVGQQPTTIDLNRLKNAGAADLYQLGMGYLQLWRVHDATTLFEKAVAADSTYHNAWIRLVECYANPMVENERALARALERARATSPGDTLFVSGLRALYETQDFSAAIASLSSVLRSPHPPADTRYYLALAYYRLGRLQDCFKYLQPLVKRDATEGRVAELSIKRYAAAGELDHAARDAADLASVYPEEATPQALMAQIELARGNSSAALEYAGHALDLDARCVPAILTRSCLYARAGDYESARVSYEKLMLFDDMVLSSIGSEGIAFVDFLAGDFDDGQDVMDEAIRQAMAAGAHRRGLALSSLLVEYLCQLGHADAAESVVERWVTEFGDVPVRLARARIQLLKGNFDAGDDVLAHLTSEKTWVLWSRRLALDPTELVALSEIAQEKQGDALDRLMRDEKDRAAVDAGAAQRRDFFAGYAAFQSGNAEAAIVNFEDGARRFYGVEFPYHGDPVLYVQSYFYRAEAQLAGGRHAAARESYTTFLGYWGEAAWDLDAVARARQKLKTLGEATAPPQG